MAYIEYYFVTSFFLFFSYFILVTILGFAFYLILDKQNSIRKLSLLSILKSFSLGLCLHIIFSMVIISFQIFNFFTIYLPLILIDIGFLIYWFEKNSEIFRSKFHYFSWKKILLLLKQNSISILVLSIAIFMQYILQMYFIEYKLSLPASDPYLWFRNVWWVHKNGALNYNYLKAYTPGFVLFNASIISITDDFYIIYFFCKYLPFFLSTINMLVLFEISKTLFKKKIYIFFALSIYLSMSYFFFRNILFIPSTLATTLGFLFLLFLKDGSILNKIMFDLRLRKDSLKGLTTYGILLRGIILSGIIMAHSLYGLFYLIFYFLYEFYLFIIGLKFNKKITNSKILVTTKFLKYIFTIFLVTVLMIFPWYIGTSFYLNSPLFNSYIYYISSLSAFHPLSDILKIGKFFYDLASKILSCPVYKDIDKFYSDDILDFFNLTGAYHLYRYTIRTGITFIVIGIILPFNKFFDFNEKQRNIVRFIKFTFILTFLIYLLSDFLNFRGIPFLSGLNQFFKYYLRRLFDLFGGFWAILFVLSFIFVIQCFPRLLLKSRYMKQISKRKSEDTRLKKDRLANYLKNPKFTSKILKNKILNKIINLHFVTKSLNKLKSIKRRLKKNLIKKTLSIPIIILVIFLSGFYYTTNYRRIAYYNLFYNSQTRVVLYAGNFFNENPLERETTLLLQKEEYNYIYSLIESKNLKKTYYEFITPLNYTKYSEFKEYVDLMNVSYVLFNIGPTDEDFKTNLFSNFNILYNDTGDWIFLELK